MDLEGGVETPMEIFVVKYQGQQKPETKSCFKNEKRVQSPPCLFFRCWNTEVDLCGCTHDSYPPELGSEARSAKPEKQHHMSVTCVSHPRAAAADKSKANSNAASAETPPPKRTPPAILNKLPKSIWNCQRRPDWFRRRWEKYGEMKKRRAHWKRKNIYI